MALNVIGLGVRVPIPSGITNTPLEPIPSFIEGDGKYIIQKEIVERVTNVVANPSTDAEAFDAIFDLTSNALVTLAGDFNSTGKTVNIFGVLQQIRIAPQEIYARPSNMEINYLINYTAYVEVVPNP